MRKLKKPYNEINFDEQTMVSLYGESTAFHKERMNVLFERFKEEFNVDGAYVASSSGRVEVCGNHTDHNGGKVVCCAISLDTLAMFLPTDDGQVYIKSEGYNDIIVDIDGMETEKQGSPASLVRGVAVYFKEKGYNVGGFNACFTSNVLGGAGISSSASFEVLIAEIFNFLYNNSKISKEEKVFAAHFAENKYFGKPCGMLDQSAIAYGGLKKLDFSNKNKIKVTEIDNTLSSYTLILINTGGSHADLTDEYASIPQEMFSVAKALGKERLVEIKEEVFYNKIPAIKKSVCDRAINRAIHFYEENQRVDQVAFALDSNDYHLFLDAINASGESSLWKLQNCYVGGSTEQPIPQAIALVKKHGFGGAVRVHGGGFAGSILNVVKNDKVDEFIKVMSKYFELKDIIPLRVRSVGTIVL